MVGKLILFIFYAYKNIYKKDEQNQFHYQTEDQGSKCHIKYELVMAWIFTFPETNLKWRQFFYKYTLKTNI